MTQVGPFSEAFLPLRKVKPQVRPLVLFVFEIQGGDDWTIGLTGNEEVAVLLQWLAVLSDHMVQAEVQLIVGQHLLGGRGCLPGGI